MSNEPFHFTKDEAAKLKSDVEAHDEILRGNRQTGKGGLVPFVTYIGTLVIGPDEKSGLVSRMVRIERTIWFVGAVVAGIEVISKLWPLIQKVMKP